MLYNPQWQDKVLHGISLRGLIAWLETMPPDQSYSYTDPFNCVLGQYLRSTGNGGIVNFSSDPVRTWLYFIASGYARAETDPRATPPAYTFGAALERARGVAETSESGPP